MRHSESLGFVQLFEPVDKTASALVSDAVNLGKFNSFTAYISCGAITGDCVLAPLWGLASGIVNYTSYWHFQNHTAGADVHGNPWGGYNYAKLAVKGDVDNMAAAWLVGDHLDDGKGGMKGMLRGMKGLMGGGFPGRFPGG